MEYTLPQISELLKQINFHIRFEIDIVTAPFRGMFGGGEEPKQEEPNELTEEDVQFLEQMFS